MVGWDLFQADGCGDGESKSQGAEFAFERGSLEGISWAVEYSVL